MCTAISGFVSLIDQVVWQRYLAILVGSEARSLSLVVAVFLLGLAAGYQFFGSITEKQSKRTRYSLMKFYGYMELLIAVYAVLFPSFFKVLKTISFNTHSHLAFDFLISLGVLFTPTFLMGASIPLLTMLIPENTKEVSLCHAKIYGWNTVGACLGVLAGGFYLIPSFGLPLTLYISGFLNLFIAIVFMANPLKGFVQKKDELTNITNPLSQTFLYSFVFLTGALIIGFEIIFVRILNLTLGTHPYNFTLVLFAVILGLGTGSLFVNTKKLNVLGFIKKTLGALFCLFLVYMTVPYWPSWLSTLRVSLTSIPSNYHVFLAFSLIFCVLFLSIPMFLLGQLLPMAYALLYKTKQNYGLVCGRLYFFNTLGTVLGAVVLGYLSFSLWNLDVILKASLVLLSLLSVFAVFSVRKQAYSLLGLALIFLMVFLILPLWDRQSHKMGIFRQRQATSQYFKGFFHIINTLNKNKVVFFEDGPQATITVTERKRFHDKNAYELLKRKEESFSHIGLSWIEAKPQFKDYSLTVNGKSDGNTIFDFSTTYWLAVLPYLLSDHHNHNLKVANIGLGAGVTAGVFGRLSEVKDVTVLEISQKVIKGMSWIKNNFDPLNNPKVKIVKQDAFKFFTRSQEKFDIISSEPSNPWVIGVENLFTQEFYEMAVQSLNPEGLFAQWFHAYSSDPKMFLMIFQNLVDVFGHVKMYKIGVMDYLFLASKKPLNQKSFQNKFSNRRFSENFVKILSKDLLGVQRAKDIELFRVLGTSAIRWSTLIHGFKEHSLEFPNLSFLAYKNFFLGTKVNPYHIVPDSIKRKALSVGKGELFEFYTKNYNKNSVKDLCYPSIGTNMFCSQLSWYEDYKNQKLDIKNRFSAYISLRDLKLIPKDSSLLSDVRKEIKKGIKALPKRHLSSDFLSLQG